jgi:hypothetical protein
VLNEGNTLVLQVPRVGSSYPALFDISIVVVVAAVVVTVAVVVGEVASIGTRLSARL